ncbi:N-acetylglutaminylglutamine amidotransferase [Ectothiorhodospira variabilis]|uniref:N-acetylglutaminylglutamine amidotransferase n=1 Tax=Ectothiorhodospira variabilis TaxID=505694 RepID=UPI001EFA5072|nr:N-acetylglutaminylglutamine amidotransferase [Ectothiorhodospira variabilis]MCG5494147.1 N-acetylglutaminylglutamine amidotransferase [Ectothiorhodospira variabilis]MCG5497378.1 N-acetylglutaminylglutamine amidotransferase [Ectothiorhodospira variabilis]MCG5503323.1 N-acetylglutaminylglutamine amidotransferase [Ectothiorhodospira variabilis]MCG5506589.1 N-acetylglutaminylglutamine amidotransferase [Ectothiorhodospira variabilis]
MCGICGELHFKGTRPDLASIRRMLDRLERRGPDHEGSYSDGPLAFGHRRLSILDLSERSNQPMVDPELGLAVVFNGTLYNFRELRAELAGRYRFFSTGDTEVILKAYHAWGEDCVKRFHGMFAFAVWDLREQRLFLGRDRMGIKPLYYSLTDQRLRFASNIQALLAAGDVDTGFDPVALHHHFTLHAVVPAPRTLFKGVRKLRPGHTLTLEHDGRVREQRYWALEAVRPDTPLSPEEWTQAIHDSLRQAVKKRLEVADVPVGVLLSGGLDSSLLVALLAESGVRNLQTFTVGFEDQPEEKGSEFEFSDPVAERYATVHHRFHVPNDQVLQRLPEAVDQMAEPMVGQDAVAFYLLSEQVSQHVKVVQSGQGADEVFAGYFWYPRMVAETEGSRVERFARHYFDRDHDEFLQMLAPELVSEDHTRALIEAALNEPGADTLLDAVLRLDVTTLVVDDPVKRVDNMTMAWGLEARVPFLDHELVELAARMPPELKLAEGGKGVLKHISRGLLPDSVIDRPKGYFPLPALKYVRGPFLDFMRDILDSQACRERGLYQRDYVQRLLAEPEKHLTRIQGSKLWHLALLEFWLQRQGVS